MDRDGRSDDAVPADHVDRIDRVDPVEPVHPVDPVLPPALVAEPVSTARLPTRNGAVVRQWVDAVEGVVEDGRDRAATSLVAPSGRRRWPWSVGAAVVGAAAGAAFVLLVRRLVGEDAPDAQEPEQLQAVVDSGLPLAPGAPPPAP